MQQTERRSFGKSDEVREHPEGRAEVPQVGGADPLQVVDAFGRAWSDHDLGTALAMLTVDCLFDATGPAPDGTSCIGPDAIRAVWAPIFDDPGSRFDVEETFPAADRVVQRWCYRFAGGHVRGVDLFRVRDGKIAEKLSYVKG